MKISERLKELRKTNHLTQFQVAATLHINLRQYQKYEYAEQEPTASVIVAFADCFNVSTDYLLGRSDSPMYEPCSGSVSDSE